MKTNSRLLAIGLIIALAAMAGLTTFGGARPVSASFNYQLPLPALSSGFQLQNLSSSAASVSLQYYNSAGAAAYSTTDTLGANASKSYYVPNVLPTPNGRYSLVVSSDQPLNVLVNEVTATGASPYVAATHSGVRSEDTATTMYMPWVISNYYGWDAILAVQNAGSAAADISVDFYFSGATTPQKTYTQTLVPMGGVFYLDLSQAPYRTDLPTGHPNGFFGSAKARSSQPLAVAVNYTDPTRRKLVSYNGAAAGGARLFAPQVTKNYYGFNSGLTVVNLQSTAVALTVKYYPSGSTTPSYTQTVASLAAGATWNQYLGGLAGLPAPGVGFNGSAVIESTGNVVGIAVHDSTVGQAAGYNLIPIATASSTLYLPQVVRAYFGFESGWQIVNTTSNAANVTVKYYPGGSTTPSYTQTLTLGANAAWTNYVGGALGAPLGTNFNGGAVISSNQPIVGIANFVAPGSGDTMQVYNAFKP